MQKTHPRHGARARTHPFPPPPQLRGRRPAPQPGATPARRSPTGQHLPGETVTPGNRNTKRASLVQRYGAKALGRQVRGRPPSHRARQTQPHPLSLSPPGAPRPPASGSPPVRGRRRRPAATHRVCSRSSPSPPAAGVPRSTRVCPRRPDSGRSRGAALAVAPSLPAAAARGTAARLPSVTRAPSPPRWPRRAGGQPRRRPGRAEAVRARGAERRGGAGAGVGAAPSRPPLGGRYQGSRGPRRGRMVMAVEGITEDRIKADHSGERPGESEPPRSVSVMVPEPRRLVHAPWLRRF